MPRDITLKEAARETIDYFFYFSDYHTYARTKTELKDILAVIGEDTLLPEIRPIHAIELVKYCLKKGNKKITITLKLALLERILNYCYSCGYISRTFPMPKVPRDKAPYVAQVPTYKDFLKIRKYFRNQNDKELYDFAIVAYYTGYRSAEILEAPPNCINWQTKEITLRESKTSRLKTLPLHRRAQAVLRHRPNMFTINKSTLANRWRKMRVATGLKEITPHCLRHAFVTALKELGADVTEIKQLSYHASTGTLSTYVHQTKKVKDRLRARIYRM